VVKAGRYGPYASHGGVNATLPNDKSPDTITLDEAVALIDARAERTGGKPTGRRTSRAKTPARKPAAAAPAAKKPKAARKAKSAAK
jgi:DNA topoisomerase-1